MADSVITITQPMVLAAGEADMAAARLARMAPWRTPSGLQAVIIILALEEAPEEARALVTLVQPVAVEEEAVMDKLAAPAAQERSGKPALRGALAVEAEARGIHQMEASPACMAAAEGAGLELREKARKGLLSLPIPPRPPPPKSPRPRTKPSPSRMA